MSSVVLIRECPKISWNLRVPYLGHHEAGKSVAQVVEAYGTLCLSCSQISNAILFLVSRDNGLTSVFYACLPCAGVVNGQRAAPVRRRRVAHRWERRSPTPLGRPRR